MAGNSFSAGLEFGRSLGDNYWRQYDLGRDEARQKEYDDYRRAQWERERQQRLDYERLATGGQTGVPGVTQAMTVPGAGGMGPVADARDVDQMPAPAVPTGGPVAAPDPVTPLGSGGAAMGNPTATLPQPPGPDGKPMSFTPDSRPVPLRQGQVDWATQAFKQEQIGKIMLQNGNVTGYNAATQQANDLRKRASDEAFGHQLMSMSDEDFAKYADSWVNNSPNVPATLKYDPKTKQFTISSDGGGQPQKLDRVQAMTYMYAAHQMKNGDVGAGLQHMLSLRQEQQATAERTADRNTRLVEATGRQGLAVDTAARQDRHMSILESAEARKAAAAERQATASERYMPVPGATDVDGSPIAMNKAGQAININTGKPPTSAQYMKDPAGMPTRKDVADLTKQIMDGGGKDDNGKPWTVKTARDSALQMLGMPGASGGGIEIDPEKLKAALAPKAGTASGPKAMMGPSMEGSAADVLSKPGPIGSAINFVTNSYQNGQAQAQGTRDSFDRDFQTMGAREFIQKYTPLQQQLDVGQNLRLIRLQNSAR